MTTSANADWVADPPIGTPPERPRRRRCGACCPGGARRCRRPVRSELSCGLLTNADTRGTTRSRPSAYTYRATTWCNAIIAPSTEPASKVTPAVTANGPNGPRPVARTEREGDPRARVAGGVDDVVGADGDGQRPRRDPVEDPEERQAHPRSAADRAVGAHLLTECRGGLEPEERRDAEGEHPAHPVDGEQVGAPGLQPRPGIGLRGMGERHDVEQHDHPQLEGEDDGHDRRPEGDAPIADHRHHRPRGERPPPPRAAQLPRSVAPSSP